MLTIITIDQPTIQPLVDNYAIMKKFTQPPYIHIFDFMTALIIIICGLYALYLMFTSPYEGGSFSSAVRPIALGIISVLFGIYHARFAWKRYQSNK